MVTALLDAAAQQRFDRERAEHFPAGRTAVGAHVTMFHALPGDLRAEVESSLEDAADRGTVVVRVSEVFPLGRGVAYRLLSDELTTIRRRLQRRFTDHLTRQDAQGFRPHVTVQNKVTPEEARATLAQLQSGFSPYDVTAVGLGLWRYDGGPWTPLRTFPFEG